MKYIRPVLVSTLVVANVVTGSPALSWTKHLCPDQPTRDETLHAIGFQSPAKFEEVTYFGEYGAVLRALVNFWATPREDVVYA